MGARVVLVLALAGCTPVEEAPQLDATAPFDAGLAQDAPETHDAATSTVVDAGFAPDASLPGPTIEIGTGENSFEPVVEGQTMPLVRGLQGSGRFGGFHIWVGARVRRMNPDGIRLTFRLSRVAGALELAQTTRRLNLTAVGAAHEVWHFPLIVADCCRAAGQPVVMEVDATDSAGAAASDQRRVVAEMKCAGPTGIDACP